MFGRLDRRPGVGSVAVAPETVHPFRIKGLRMRRVMRRGDESLFPFHCIRRSSSLGYHKCASVLACAGSKLSFFVATFARCPQGVTDDWEKCAMRTRAAVWSTALWKLRRTLGARPTTLRALVERAKARLHQRPLLAVRIRGFNNAPGLNLNVGGCIARSPMRDGAARVSVARSPH